MRCRDVDAMWDEVRGEGTATLNEAVHTHVDACPTCNEAYQQYEVLAHKLQSLPDPEPTCDLARKVVEHIALLQRRERLDPVHLVLVDSPIGRLYVGHRESRIAYIGIDMGETFEDVVARVERRLRRPTDRAALPPALRATIATFFTTWHVDASQVDVSDLTPFEQATLRATVDIPPGEVRSYGWLAKQIGRPSAARAVGRVMARNPIPILVPCHRVVDATGALHRYGYGVEFKARLLAMEGYHPAH
ncbi:MAG: methylated-DNA--[protein]-cysteine S-methyltransferase [Candidatus Eremiobacteraeota bacterium]|nr:methylated-DNA--[protein]-cysteine S-methyltransferase [Candidatus Eremiobacteraeota bacterium]